MAYTINNVHTISGVNRLPESEKRAIYTRVLPPRLVQQFNLNQDFLDEDGNDLLRLNCPPGSSSAEMALFHQSGFPDPVLYGDITDTLNEKIHILLYVLNDPGSPRFNVDRMPDGSKTKFGTQQRNLEAELAAMQFGLAPGQVRRGLRMLDEAVQAFENFILSLGQDMHFAEPLYYHNAVLFEHYGFSYEKGRRLMESIQAGFQPGGELRKRLDGSTPFRNPEAADSIRLRSWAIHDGLLDEPFTNVTMYKWAGKHANIQTSPNCTW
jgi:hypothetical protein